MPDGPPSEFVVRRLTTFVATLRLNGFVVGLGERPFSSSGVLGQGWCDRRPDEGGGEGLPPPARVAHDPEGGGAGRRLLSRDAAVRPRPGAQRRPEAFRGVDVRLAGAVAVVIARVPAPGAADRLAAAAPPVRAGVDAALAGVDEGALRDAPLDRRPDRPLPHVGGRAHDHPPPRCGGPETGGPSSAACRGRERPRAAGTGRDAPFGDRGRVPSVPGRDVDLVGLDPALRPRRREPGGGPAPELPGHGSNVGPAQAQPPGDLPVGEVQAREAGARRPDPRRPAVAGRGGAGRVVEAGRARLAAVALAVPPRVAAPVADHRGAAAPGAADALRPALPAHRGVALRVVDQGRGVRGTRRGHGPRPVCRGAARLRPASAAFVTPSRPAPRSRDEPAVLGSGPPIVPNWLEDAVDVLAAEVRQEAPDHEGGVLERQAGRAGGAHATARPFPLAFQGGRLERPRQSAAPRSRTVSAPTPKRPAGSPAGAAGRAISARPAGMVRASGWIRSIRLTNRTGWPRRIASWPSATVGCVLLTPGDPGSRTASPSAAERAVAGLRARPGSGEGWAAKSKPRGSRANGKWAVLTRHNWPRPPGPSFRAATRAVTSC